MNRSMDEFTNQAIDMVLENNALHKRVLEPLRHKLMPYILCVAAFNITLMFLVVYLIFLISG
ncbi:hypothetical protein [Dishui Lake phycodnavirus 4]|nr:hypothetical protein [Dishui Lake phycodnavirus 4]